MGMEGIEKAVTVLIVLGIAVFVLNILLTLNYSSYAQTGNTLFNQYCKAGSTPATCTGANDIGAGVYANYTSKAGNVNNTFASNLTLAIVALVLIAIIVAVLMGIRATGMGGSGSFL